MIPLPPSFFVPFDIAVLLRFQRFTQWTQKSAGLTCFDLAHMALGGYLVAFLLIIGPLPWWGKLISLLAISSLILGAVLDIERTKKLCRSAPNHLNVKAYFNALPRFIWWCILVVMSPFLVLMPPHHWSDRFIPLRESFFLCYTYLVSCTPLPPAKSKVREWLDTPKAVPVMEGQQ